MTSTIFVSTFNRLGIRRIIDSYAGFNDYKVVIIDNGTDEPRCRRVLQNLESEVEAIYYLADTGYHADSGGMDRVEHNMHTAVNDRYGQVPTEWFANTDADICFEGADRGCLDAYIEIAEANPGYVVGPHLLVQDVPAGYPLRNRVVVFEGRLLFMDTMNIHNGIPWSKWAIDSHFLLYPGRDWFKRNPPQAIRVGPPYVASHLDWYVDFFNPTEEQLIFLEGDKGGSWGHHWLKGYYREFSRNKEVAFKRMFTPKRHFGGCGRDDLCNSCFFISWCYQYGVGTEKNIAESKRHLDRAIPLKYDFYHGNQKKDYLAMVYDNNFSCLGW